jgi:hypothetical protein
MLLAAKPPADLASRPTPLAPNREDSLSSPWYRKWWIWAIAGGAVAAGIGTTAVIQNQQSGALNVPPHDKALNAPDK